MNKSRRITGILLACCALLMVAIAGLGVTLAKYTKSAPDKSDSAKVAGFGLTLEWAASESIFKTQYNATTENLKDTAGQAISLTVVSADTDKVIAPGTEGSITLNLGGSSEVAFALSINVLGQYTLSDAVVNAWKDKDGADYAPIVFSATVNAAAGGQNITLTNGVFTGNFQAGTSLTGSITISWSWPFETGTDDATKAANNERDTYVSSLGIAGYKVTASATATQID